MPRSIPKTSKNTQMAKAFGAPQARPARAAGEKRMPHPDRVRSRAQIQAAGGMGGGLKTKAAWGRQGSTIDPGMYFGESARGGGGVGANSGEGPKCRECGSGVIVGYNAMDKSPGDGPYCRNCWADMWVPHQRNGLASIAVGTCTMGVHWNDAEWRAIEGFTSQAIAAVKQATGQYPGPQDMPRMHAILDPIFASNFKRSMRCPDCHTDVVFSPTADDVPMQGINQ